MPEIILCVYFRFAHFIFVLLFTIVCYKVNRLVMLQLRLESVAEQFEEGYG